MPCGTAAKPVRAPRCEAGASPCDPKAAGCLTTRRSGWLRHPPSYEGRVRSRRRLRALAPTPWVRRSEEPRPPGLGPVSRFRSRCRSGSPRCDDANVPDPTCAHPRFRSRFFAFRSKISRPRREALVLPPSPPGLAARRSPPPVPLRFTGGEEYAVRVLPPPRGGSPPRALRVGGRGCSNGLGCRARGTGPSRIRS